MTILVDFSQVAICGIQKAVASMKFNVLTKDLCRHIILNSLRQHIFKFKKDYGKVVICCDSRSYWRKEYFPYYKITRKKKREKSDLDWSLIFETMTEIKDIIKTDFPYKLLEIDRCEADDIIGTLAPRLSAHEPVIIISSDGDFSQVLGSSNIKQYSPQVEVYKKCDNPGLWLKEKIITGDRKDSIPSVLSNDNVFVEEIRQKPVTAKIKQYYMSVNFDDPSIDNYRNIQRNKILIDFNFIPFDIKQLIVSEYEQEQTGNKTLVMKYLIKNNLKLLLESLDEF